MKNYYLFLLFFVLTLNINAQNITKNSNSVKRYFHRDGIIAMEKYYGNDKKVDSIRTYHKNGRIDEKIYYLNGRYHDYSYKYNAVGKKITTWKFNNGRLVQRIDHILEHNKKDEEKIKKLHVQLKELNAKIIENSRDSKSRIQRTYIRYRLGNRILALHDLNWMRYRIIKIAKHKKIKPSGKILGSIYDMKASIYAYFEMKNYASHYRYKAVKINPENNRLIYNLGAYLYTIKSYKLALYYLNKVLEEWPKHAFTHRLLAAYYTDFEDYKKAKYHIDIAFPKEKGLLKFGYGSLEYDIRTIRGFISHNLNNSENGIKDLKEAIRLNKNNSFAHRNLGVVYYELGKDNLACKYLQKAKELDYVKIHDRDDLQAYMELSCENAVLKKVDVLDKKPKKLSLNLNEKPYIYPNPTKGDINIENISYTNFDYSIFNFTGKLITKGISTKKSLNISTLPSGLYILKIVKNEVTETFRVIKE